MRSLCALRSLYVVIRAHILIKILALLEGVAGNSDKISQCGRLMRCHYSSLDPFTVFEDTALFCSAHDRLFSYSSGVIDPIQC